MAAAFGIGHADKDHYVRAFAFLALHHLLLATNRKEQEARLGRFPVLGAFEMSHSLVPIGHSLVEPCHCAIALGSLIRRRGTGLMKERFLHTCYVTAMTQRL